MSDPALLRERLESMLDALERIPRRVATPTLTSTRSSAFVEQIFRFS
jgi:hypothetical protein